MKTSETITAIAPALIKAQGSMVSISKTGNNPAFRSRYMTLDAILDTVRPILTANGLGLMQDCTEYVTHEGRIVAVTIESRIIHTSGEWVASTSTIPVTKPDAHGIGSAITYGRRYSIASMLAISADDDDDGNAAVQPRQAPSAPLAQGRPLQR